MSKLLTISSIILIFVQISYAQQPSVREWRERADSAYVKGNYPAAFKFYEAALKYRLSAQDSLVVLYQYAESARQFNAFDPAEKAYQTIADKDQGKQYPLSRYWLAVVEQRQEKYEEAALHFEQFLQQNPAPNSPYREWAQQGLENAEQARRTTGLPIPIHPTRLGRDINDSNAEYVADFLGDTLIYSTLNDIYNKDTHKPPRKYTKIYTSISGQESKPWDALNEPGKHVSNLVFNRDQTRMYYTVCEYKENSVIEVRCDLYLRERQDNGTWGDKKKLTINTPDNNYTTTQPAIAYDAQRNRELLFFVSDRPLNAADTTKDLNIWYGNIGADGEVASAIPADALNTDGNEASPAFYAPTQTLYFSSTGRTPNYGGYDVYEADMTNSGGWTAVKPLNRPINSGYDELHFLLRDTKNGTDAYFSTNMPIDTVEETYVDPTMKACCWDIFKVNYEIKLQVITLLAANGNQVPLNGATISLYVETPTGNKLDTTLTLSNGNTFLFTLLPNKKYIIIGKHPNFNYEQTETVDPIRTEYIGGKIVEKKFVFAPVRLLVNTFKRRNGEPLDSAQVIVTSNDGRTALGTRIDNNSFAFEVQRGKQYQINGTRFAFYDESASADLTAASYRDSLQIERNLYFRQELEVLVVDADSNAPLGGATIDRKLLSDSGLRNLEVRTNPGDSNRFLYGFDVFDMTEKYRLNVSRSGYSDKTQDLSFSAQQILNSNGKFTVIVAL
ncbi:MAG: tetratricopeptide repeat protein, partial [Saprospiraceae bacterium]